MDTDVSGSVSLANLEEVCACLSLAVTSDRLDAFLQANSFGGRATLMHM